MPATVLPDSFLTLHYRLSGPQGEVISTFGGAPATLSLGTGALSPALEARLLGLSEGAQASFDVPAGEAFGPRNADLLQWLSRSALAELGEADAQYSAGEVLHIATPDGKGQVAALLVQVRPDAVLLDFNHPLCGQALRFEVHIIGVL